MRSKPLCLDRARLPGKACSEDAATAARRELTGLSDDEDTAASSGSKPAPNAVAYVLNLSRQGLLLEVELLNVQIPIESGEIRRFVSQR